MRYVFWIIGLWVCLVCGCALHHVDEEADRLRVGPPMRYSEPSTGADLSEDWNDAWWESFGDDDLNRFVEAGLAANLGIQQFVARIEQAAALAHQAGTRLYPSIDLDTGYQSQWDGETAARDARDRQDTADLGFPLGWELDIWGRLSALRRAQELTAQATSEDWLGARLLLSTAIAQVHFEILEQRRQLEVIQAQIDLNKTLLQLTFLRYGQGQSSIVDVLQQQEQLEATQARVPPTEARIGQLLYSLDVLLGRVPAQGEDVTPRRLGRPAPLPAVGVPAQLLTRRPDLRAAQKRILALDHEVGAAVAEQLPTLSVGGSVRWTGDPGLSDTVTTVFAGLAGPVFDAGRRRSEVSFRRARLQEALAGYADLYLAALSEVEIALLEERKYAEELVLVERQLATAQRLLTEARNRYSQGLTDYLPVFTSLAIVQNLERNVVSARRRVLSARVGLHRALGGPMPEPPAPLMVSLAHD